MLVEETTPKTLKRDREKIPMDEMQAKESHISQTPENRTQLRRREGTEAPRVQKGREEEERSGEFYGNQTDTESGRIKKKFSSTLEELKEMEELKIIEERKQIELDSEVKEKMDLDKDSIPEDSQLEDEKTTALAAENIAIEGLSTMSVSTQHVESIFVQTGKIHELPLMTLFLVICMADDMPRRASLTTTCKFWRNCVFLNTRKIRAKTFKYDFSRQLTKYKRLYSVDLRGHIFQLKDLLESSHNIHTLSFDIVTSGLRITDKSFKYPYLQHVSVEEADDDKLHYLSSLFSNLQTFVVRSYTHLTEKSASLLSSPTSPKFYLSNCFLSQQLYKSSFSLSCIRYLETDVCLPNYLEELGNIFPNLQIMRIRSHGVVSVDSGLEYLKEHRNVLWLYLDMTPLSQEMIKVP
eukprot:TRINITY_DN2726_c0_g1_i2.p1 TRINITY_DN2726_c0_g1~~TRINITY_DN2726_c0_g1_i2.p1  ORF type:complete len:409 (+),score=71.44 TRINITY_DN2726_c0_g1_i2:110-1336(+)